MKIVIIGAGAMGLIYGAHLSTKHDVTMVCTSEEKAELIRREGIVITRDGADTVYRPDAICGGTGTEAFETVILFTKALQARAALSENRALIGPDTTLVCLMNGSGHEELLVEFAPLTHVVIGTTMTGGTRLAGNHVREGGSMLTNIGMVVPDEEGRLPGLCEAFAESGFDAHIYDNIRQLIWNKLFVNSCSSTVTGVLKCEGRFLGKDDHAFALVRMLLHEAVAVAHALGLEADEEKLAEMMRANNRRSPKGGMTSICVDMRSGVKTEVETIAGSVVRAGHRTGVPVPCHEFIVELVHAMEDLAEEED